MKKELYRFVEGLNVWTVTSADESQEFNSEIYTSESIGRTENETKTEISRSNIEVTLSIENEMARRWMRSTTDDVVSLTIFKHDEATTKVVWKGRLVSVKPDVERIVLTFESIFTSLRRSGLRKKFQRACPHVHYGRGCFLNKEDWRLAAVVTAISSDGLTLTVPLAASYEDGYFLAGMICTSDEIYRFIVNHVGSTITLIRPSESLNQAFSEGDGDISIFAGCNRTKEVCKDKFENEDNYGGFAFIPLKNPFGGSSIV